MGRRRYVSTDISTDSELNRLAMESDFAALFYSWLIPHADDDGIAYGDLDKLMFKVLPGRRDKTADDLSQALRLMVQHRLVWWDEANNMVYFPIHSFYKYQSYIPAEKRRDWDPLELSAKTATNSDELLLPAKNAAFPSPSLSSSLSSSVSVIEDMSPIGASDEPEKPARQKPEFDPETDAYQLALLLRAEILRNLASARVPKDTPAALAGWAAHIDRMIRLDKRNPQDIERIIRWSQNDPFWRANILSTDKLRKQWDKLVLQSQRQAREPPIPRAYASLARYIERSEAEEGAT